MTSKSMTKRGKGRPAVGEAEVGRIALIEATARLLSKLPPSKVSISSVAREAGVDRALVHYYFGTRTKLLTAVVNHLRTSRPKLAQDESPVETLSRMIARSIEFTRSARNMQRLMLEELLGSRDEEAIAQVQTINEQAIGAYRELVQRDGGETIIDADPLFLHLMLIGVSDFFVSATPLVKLLAGPDADLEKLSADYSAFVSAVMLNGLKKR